MPHAREGEVSALLGTVLPRLTFNGLGHFISVTLWPANQCIHPARMHGLWHEHQHKGEVCGTYYCFCL